MDKKPTSISFDIFLESLRISKLAYLLLRSESAAHNKSQQNDVGKLLKSHEKHSSMSIPRLHTNVLLPYGTNDRWSEY